MAARRPNPFLRAGVPMLGLTIGGFLGLRFFLQGRLDVQVRHGKQGWIVCEDAVCSPLARLLRRAGAVHGHRMNGGGPAHLALVPSRAAIQAMQLGVLARPRALTSRSPQVLPQQHAVVVLPYRAAASQQACNMRLFHVAPWRCRMHSGRSWTCGRR